MLLPMLILGIPFVCMLAMVVLVARDRSLETTLRRRTRRIIWEASHGWSNDSIRRLHRGFCDCQIDYLRHHNATESAVRTPHGPRRGPPR